MATYDNFFKDLLEVKEVDETLLKIDEILSNYDAEEISVSQAIAATLEVVRPHAAWRRVAVGNWCSVYKCTGCETDADKMSAFCPSCGAVMEE